MKRIILLMCFILLVSMASSCDKNALDAESSDETAVQSTAAATDTATDTEAAVETESAATETQAQTETEAKTEAATEAQTAAQTQPPKPQNTPPSQSQNSTDIDIDVSIGGGNNGTGSSSSAPKPQAPAVQRTHVYANAPAGYEDNSTTLAFMPLKAEGATDPYGSYNKPRVIPEKMYPGQYIQGNAAYSTSLVGYDGFIFCGDSFSDYDGTSLYSSARIPSIKKMMTDRLNYFKSRNIDLYVLIVPNKNTIYHDYMPEGYTMGSYRRFDQVVSILRECGITVVDARESLSAAKAKYPARALYYKTDTHWNNHGAYEAYIQLMNVIKKDHPNVVIHTRDEYQINYCETFMKDQAFNLGIYDATSEIGPVYTLKSGKTARLSNYTPRNPWGQFQFCYQWPNGYSDRLYYYQWTNDYNIDAPSMYMIRDSYSIALNGFLKDSFYQSTFDWTFNMSKRAVTRANAEIVIIEACEKNIADVFNHAAFID